MKVLVCGGRAYDDHEAAFSALDRVHNGGFVDMVIHGGAKGADALAGRWARERGVQEVICPANWEKRGSWAGPNRNAMMVMLSPDIVLAFPGGKGTADMTSRARRAGIEIREVSPDNSEGSL